MLRKIYSSKGLSNIGTGNLETGGWRHHHWRHYKEGWMWHLGKFFSGGIGSAGLTIRPDDLKYFFNLNGHAILFGQNF